jgi:signal transduction histidine kinase/ActR/RegA family two-component response regulator
LLTLAVAIAVSQPSGFHPQLILYPVVVAIAVSFGMRPGLLAAALSTPILFFTAGSHGVVLREPVDWMTPGLYLLICTVLCVMSEHVHKAAPPMDESEFQRRLADEKARFQSLLRENEERYYLLFEHMLNGVVYHKLLYDDSGKAIDCVYLAANKAYLRMLGLTGDVTGKKASEVLPGLWEQSPALLEAIARVTASGNSETFDYFFEPQKKWYALSLYRPHTDHFVVVLEDIDERNRAKEQLQENEARYSQLFEYIINGIVYQKPIFDESGKVVDLLYLEVNNSFASSRRRKVKDFIGRKFSEVYPGVKEQDPELLESFSRVVASGVPETFEHYTKPLKIWSKFSVYRTPQGDLAIVVDDITERKQAEDALRDTAQRLQLALSAAQMGIWDWNISTGENVIDDRVYEIYGVQRRGSGSQSPSEEQVSTPGVVDLTGGLHAQIHPDDFPGTTDIVQKMTADPSVSSFVHSYRIIRADEKVRAIQVRCLLLRDSEGKTVRLIAMLQDVTDRRNLEAQLVQAQKMEAIGRLAGGVAHDFNNNLGVILGYAELAMLQGFGADRMSDYLNRITQAAIHSRDITRQLLAFSRKGVITPRIVNVNRNVEETQKTLNRLIGEDVHLKTSLQDDLWLVRADPAQIDQITINLAVNARDAMPDGGLLSIETKNITISEAYCRDRLDAKPGDYVQISVSDTGCGMDRETMSHIFEPFFTTKGPAKGTGLGLATVYGIVTQNNGFINVYSEPGRGTTFAIFLPRALEPGQAESQPKQAAATGSGAILLVEDDENVRAMVAEMLRVLGYTTWVAASPVEALEICAETGKPIDCILTDVIMPGMSGKELVDKISALRPGIRSLYMSGYTSDAIAHHGVLEEGYSFIQKPFDLNGISKKLQDVMRTGKARSAYD